MTPRYSNDHLDVFRPTSDKMPSFHCLSDPRHDIRAKGHCHAWSKFFEQNEHTERLVMKYGEMSMMICNGIVLGREGASPYFACQKEIQTSRPIAPLVDVDEKARESDASLSAVYAAKPGFAPFDSDSGHTLMLHLLRDSSRNGL